MFTRLPKLLAPLLLAGLLLLTSCGGSTTDTGSRTQTTTRPKQTQAPKPTQTPKPKTQTDTDTAAKPVKGGALNKFFPKASGDYKVVFTQEKTGFAEAKLKQGSKDVAVLSINDTANNPSAAAKFKGSSQKIGGYPAVSQGSTGTAILVANRYQVKVQSRDTSFSSSNRETWLQKFNLSGLSKLK